MPDLPNLEAIWQDLPLLDDAWPFLLLLLRLTIALLLYLFLFSAFRTLLVELRPAPAVPMARPVERAPRSTGHVPERARWLEVLDCEGSPDLVGRRFPLERVTLIGRTVDSTAVLPDARVSAHHARLTNRNGDWWLEDLESMNGTFIDDRRVNDATPVEPGAQLRFGPVIARLATGRRRR